MGPFKFLKNLVRRLFFHPFGYDVVPLRGKGDGPRTGGAEQAGRAETSGSDIDQYRQLFGEDAVEARRFYNVGARAAFSHPAWTKVNHPSEWYGDQDAHLEWDLLALTPMPVEEGQARIVFSRYTLEHVTDEAGQNFLSAAFRALAPGGYLRVIVPDIDIYYAAYQAGDRSLFYKPKANDRTYPNEQLRMNPNQATLEQQFLWTFASSASELHPEAPQPIRDEEFKHLLAEMSYEDALNACTARCSMEVQRRHPAIHVNWYNAEKMERMMRAAGFTMVYRSGFCQSRCPVLRGAELFDGRRPEIGLYMEAVK